MRSRRRKKLAASALVALEMRQQHVVAARDVEVDRRRDFAEIRDGPLDESRCRLAFVDVDRAAVPQHHVEIVVAAERVAPRQPVDDDRRLFGEERPDLRDGLLIGTEHPLRVDHTLGQIGGSGREQDLGDGVGAHAPEGVVDLGSRLGRKQAGKRGRPQTGHRVAGGDQFCRSGVDRGQRRCEFGGVLNKDQPWREQCQNVFQLREIARGQRIGWRHRRHRHADVHGRKRDERMVDAVVGQDHDRAVDRQATAQQCLPDRAHAVERDAVTELAPTAIRRPLGQKQLLRRARSPVHEILADTPGIRSQCLRRAQHAAAIAQWGDIDGGRCEREPVEQRLRHEDPPCRRKAT